jgi:hypothetical protein
MKPTTQPTLFPTIPFSNRWEKVVSTYKSLLPTSAAYQILYSDLSMNGKQSTGSCTEWSILLRDTFHTIGIMYRPVTLTLSGLDANSLLKLNDQTSNATAVKIALHSSICSTSDIVESILRTLQIVFSSTSLSYPYQAIFTCQEINWSVVKCSSDMLPVLCVECANYCSKTTDERITFPSLVISCLDAVTSSIGQLYNLFVEYSLLSPPPTLLNVISIPSSSSIKVTAQLSGAGSLICAAYLSSSGYTPPSSDVLLSQGYPVAGVQSGSSTVATYEMTNLIPASSYQIFCATKSPTSSLFSSMTTISLATSCCRLIKIKFSQPTSTFNDRSDSPLALVIDVGVVPTEKVIVTLNVINLANSSSPPLSQPMFTPSSFTFFSTSSMVTAQSNYLRSIAGSYQLQASITGPSFGDYQVVYSTGDTFVVKNTETEPLPPILQSAVFSGDGSRVVVTFLSSTNKAGALNVIKCSTLFTSIATTSTLAPPTPAPAVTAAVPAIDSTTRCVWIDSTKIEIYSIGIKVNDKIYLLPNSLKSTCTSLSDPTCSSWKYNSVQNVTVTIPTVTINPMITISLPSQLGPCDNLVIDLTASTGNGGRSWGSFSLQAESLSPNITILQKFLSQVKSIATPVVIPYTNLTAGYAYTLKVTLCNFLNSCSERSTSFVISSATNVPIVSLNSQNIIMIYRYGSLKLFSLFLSLISVHPLSHLSSHTHSLSSVYLSLSLSLSAT